MATLDELQQQLNALQQKVDAITVPPTDYYTQRYSGEETDRGVEIALGLDPNGSGIISPEHGGTGADTTQSALAALGTGVRPNAFDNPGLDINQQGITSYDTSKVSGYTVDRWWSLFSIYDVATKTLVSTNQTYGAAFRQAVSSPVRFAGKTITISVWILSGKGTLSVVKATGMNTGQVVIASTNIDGPGLYSITTKIPSDIGSVSYPYLNISVSAWVNNSIQFASPIPFKLEFGEGQTLAYQDSAGDWQLLPQPNSKYSAQLLECQRYYSKSSQNINGFSGGFLATVQQGSTEWLNLSARFPVVMAKAPTISVTWLSKVTSISQNLASDGVTFQPNAVSESGFNLLNVKGITLESDTVYLVQFSADASL